MKDIYNFIPTNIPLPYIGIIDKNDSEFLKHIKEKIKNEFGKKSRQYNIIMGNVDVNTGKNINLFFALYINKNLPENMRIPTIKDLERILTLSPKYFYNIYCHSSDLVLTSKKSYLKNKYLLENIISQVEKKGYSFSVKNPLILSGLELIPDDNLKNEYGFLLNINKNSTLENNLNFNWSHKPKSTMLEYYCPIENEGVGISLSGINGSEIYANEKELNSSNDDDRMAIIYDIPYEKELMSYLDEIEKNKKNLFLKIKKELLLINKLKNNLI